MPAPIGLQLYTVRDALTKDFDGVIRRLAAMGYAGVEPANFFGKSLQDAVKLFKSLGLAVPAAHIKLPTDSQAIDTALTLGCKYIVIPWISPDEFKSVDKIKALCAQLNEASAAAQKNGLKLAYHNHDFEFVPLDGKLPHEIMQENLDPGVGFELDTYWIKTAGQDPAKVTRELGKRAPLLHIKDGPAVKGQPMVAAGEGKIDIPAVVKAGDGSAEWLIVELDECATDMMQAVEKSYQYLVKQGLGRGRKS
jgi:sugar phosphate isomerase/epimerase